MLKCDGISYSAIYNVPILSYWCLYGSLDWVYSLNERTEKCLCRSLDWVYSLDVPGVFLGYFSNMSSWGLFWYFGCFEVIRAISIRYGEGGIMANA